MKKRTLEKMADKIEVERMKLLFGIDEARKELERLSPGKTVGEEGLRLALFISELIMAAHALGFAWGSLQNVIENGNLD